MKSKRWSINSEQWQSFGRSLWKYTAPGFLYGLVILQQTGDLKKALVAVYTALLAMTINLLSKFVTETK